MANWYCAIDGQQYGPLSTEELRALAKQGRLRISDHVRRAESEQWRKAADVRGLFPAAAEARTKTGPPPIAGSGPPPVARPAPRATPLPTAIPLQSVAVDPIHQGPIESATGPVVNIAADAAATEDRRYRRDRHPSARRQRQRMVLALSGALLVLMIAAVLIVGRSRPPGQTAADRAEGTATSAAMSDPETDPVSKIPDDTAGAPTGSGAARLTFMPIRRWLTAGMQKRVVGEHMRLHVAAAWWADGPSRERTLVVQVEITNRSADRPLHYAGWATDAGIQNHRPAVFAFRSDASPIAARTSRHAVTDAAQPQLVAPGQTVTKHLEFSLAPDVEVEHFRVMLPYEAWGLSGEVGFEIPETMVLDGPPDMVAAEGHDLPAVADHDQSDANLGDASSGQPETIVDLKTQIEASVRATEAPSAEQDPPD